MNGKSLGLRLGSSGSLQLQHSNGVLQIHTSPGLVRKTSKSLLSSYREKERCVPYVFRCLCRRKVGMMVLFLIAVLAFVSGFFTLSRETPGSTKPNIVEGLQRRRTYDREAVTDLFLSNFPRDDREKQNNNGALNPLVSHNNKTSIVPLESDLEDFKGYRPEDHPCRSFSFPPPPPPNRKRIGPRQQAKASMPNTPSASPVLHNLTYVRGENSNASESYGGSSFGGYPSLKKRNDSLDIKESMTVHCGFVKGRKPGLGSGFDIDEADLLELERFHEVIVASAIFGNYDIIQEPINVSKDAKKHVPFYMFIDEETEEYMKGSGALDSSRRIGIWKIIVVRNIPYEDARRNGKVPKLLLHRLITNVRYSIWIDGKLKLVADPYQILERFLWRQNATFAISRHYRRFDVFEEAKANKAAGKYSNASIDFQIDFYKKEGLTHYSEAKLPITSDVPEGCVIIREHIPITNLFTCLWFNEVDRFTSRDQLSFSTVRDKIMSKVNWSINMFLDCERRNFVVQAYHRELLENMPPPPPPSIPRPALPRQSEVAYWKANRRKRGRDRRSGTKRKRKFGAGNWEGNKLI